MKKKKRRRLLKTILSLLLVTIMALQGTGPIFVQAKEAIENAPRDVDFSRPDATRTLSEVGISDPTESNNTNEEPPQEETQVPSEQGEESKAEEPAVESPESIQGEGELIENKSEDEPTAEESEEIPAEVELKEPVDYYPLPEEPEGELIDYDKDSRTYKTGEKEYTTVFGGYVGTYEDDKGKFQLVDNTLVEPQRKTRSAESADAYENKANDYTVQLPKNITAEAGVKVQSGSYDIEIVPMNGDYSHSVAKDNAILYNQVYDGIDVQYTVLDANVKEDIVLHKPVEQTLFEYELRIPGLKAELKDNQDIYIRKTKTLRMRNIS